jgi:coenzyme F420-0:L-glutamate ligase/coenzyme F420-1:gamma-L-glutamate ligase
MSRVTIFGISGLPEIEPGDDLATMIVDAITAEGLELVVNDILVVTHKVVSKQEARIVEIPTEDAYRAVVLDEAASIIRRRGDLVIAQTRHGFICANAGVDRSNVRAGYALLLPIDPDRSAHRLRTLIARTTGTDIGVVVTDTFGRPWRRGLVDVAIGVSGVTPILDLKGTRDTHGNELNVTEVNVVDEIAAAADLVMGKATGIPVAIVRGLKVAGEGRATAIVRPADEDLFR